MTKKWYYGQGKHPEEYAGPFDSREDAIAEGTTMASGYHDYIIITEAEHAYLQTDVFDADDILENIYSANEDFYDPTGELPIVDATPEMLRDLENRVAQVISEWVACYNLGRCFPFDGLQTEEEVAVPKDL